MISLVFTCFFATFSYSNSCWNKVAFFKLNNDQRFQFVHDFPFWKNSDFSANARYLFEMLEVSECTHDIRTRLAIYFYMCKAFTGHSEIKPYFQSQRLMREIKRIAHEYQFEVEETVALHYLSDNLTNSQKLSTGKQYIQIQLVFEKLKTIGFDQFREYSIDGILLDQAQLMWKIGYYQQSLKFLTIAEKYAKQTEEGGHNYTQIMSYLQAYWNRKGDLEKSLLYAQKIKSFHQQLRIKDPIRLWWNQFWLGFSTIEIAEILAKQGKLNESEKLANEGYALSISNKNLPNKIVNNQAEFDALTVLIGVKIKLNKWQEAFELMNRALEIKAFLEPKQLLEKFKSIRLYNYLSQYYAEKKEFNNAYLYLKKAHQLQDELDRKTNANDIINLQKHFYIEKYTEKISDINEKEKFQKWISNSYLIILILVLLSGLLYVRILQRKRKEKEVAFQSAKNQLVYFKEAFQEKSVLVDNLRLENEKLNQEGQKSDYLEQLTKATILTEKDWSDFRTTFEKVFPNFITEQKSLFPAITQAEIRLLVLEKLELNTQEMANMLGVNKNTIHQTRLRLRKKVEKSDYSSTEKSNLSI